MKSIFLGQVRSKEYFASYMSVGESSKFVKYEKFYECNLDKPMLTKNEKIYIPDLDTTLQIADVIKSTDESVTYQTCYTIRIIENDSTIKSLEEAKKDFKRIEINKKKSEETKTELCFEEPNGMSRTISCDTIAYMSNIHNDLKLMNMKTSNIIELNKRAQEDLLKFLEYNKLSKE